MKKTNYHIIQINGTEERKIIRGSIEDYIEENPELAGNYKEIPEKDWTMDEKIDIQCDTWGL